MEKDNKNHKNTGCCGTVLVWLPLANHHILR